jgi:2-iminobutanoate/2-iminopropanoate deaminase
MMSNITRIPTPYSYSSAVVAGNQVFLGLHRGSGDNFTEQFDGTLAGIKETLAKLGLTVDNLVKVNVWLKDIQDLPVMEKRFLDHFEQDHFPARMTATTEFIDSDCLLMIDGIAYTGD